MNRIDELYKDIGEFVHDWSWNIANECFGFVVKTVKTPFFRGLIHHTRVIVDQVDDILEG